MTLIGAEDIHRAGNKISAAADDMVRAANTIDDSLGRFLRQFEELVARLEALKDSE